MLRSSVRKRKDSLMDEKTALEDLKKIRRMVHFIVPQLPDEEALSVDIWLELWQKGGEATWTHVRNRTIDELRRVTNIHFESLYSISPEEFSTLYTSITLKEKQDLLNEMFKRASLSNADEKLLYLRFYKDFSLKEIGVEFNISIQAVSQRLDSIFVKLKKIGSPLVGEINK